MRKNLRIPFYIVFGMLLTLVFTSQTSASVQTSMYPSLSQESLKDKIKVINERRLFKWENFQHFLNSFNKPVQVTFDGIIKGSAFFEGNTKTQERILIVGGGLAYDDLVKDSETLLLNGFLGKELGQEKDRPKYYPFNAYLVDFNGAYAYSNRYDITVPSFSDSSVDITKDIGAPVNWQFKVNNGGGIPKEFTENPFHVVILEHLSVLLSKKILQNINSILVPTGVLIVDNPIRLIAKSAFQIKEAQLEELQVEDVGTLYFVPDKALEDKTPRFYLYFVEGSNFQETNKIERYLEKNMLKIFNTFKDKAADKWVQTYGFDSINLKTDFKEYSPHWCSDCCVSGLCLAYKKKKN